MPVLRIAVIRLLTAALLAGAAAGSRANTTAASFDGQLVFGAVEGVDCAVRSGDRRPATVHRVEHPGRDEWWIALADGGIHRLHPAGSPPATTPHFAARWTLQDAAPRPPARELELNLETTHVDCTARGIRFAGAAASPTALDRIDRLRAATELLDRSVERFGEARWDEARDAAEQSLQIRTELLGAEHEGARAALRQAAIVQAWQGEILPALERLRTACPVPADPVTMTPEAARCSVDLIEPMLWAGQLREAVELSAAIMARIDAGWSIADAVRIRLLRTEALRLASRVAEARSLAEEVAALAERTLPPLHPLRARAISTLALAYLTGGNPEAVAVAERAVAAHEAAFGAQHVRTGLALGLLGNCYWEYGRIAESLRPAERGYAIVTDAVGPEHFLALRMMMALAGSYLLLGRDAEGLDIYVKVEAGFRRAFGEHHNGRLIALRNIGVSQRRLDRPEDALKTDLELVAAARAGHGPRHETTLAALRSLSTDYFALGRHEESLAVNEESLALHEAVYGPRHFHVLQQRSQHARIMRGLKRYDEAVAEAEAVLRDVEQTLGRTHQDTLGVMGNLADNYEAAGRMSDARATNEEFVRRFETLRAGTALSLEWRQAYFASVINVYRNLTRYYLAEGRSDDAFRSAELTKARTLLEALSLRRAEDAGVLPEADSQALAVQEKAIAELDQRIGAARSVEDRVRLEGERNAAAERLAGERARLRQQFPRYAQLTEVRITTAAEAPKLIRADTALVSYSLADRRLAAFVVTRDRMTAHDLGNLEALAGIIEAYRQLLDPRSAARVWRVGDDYVVAAVAPPGASPSRVTADEVAQRLARQLLEPIAPRLRGKRKWILSPDGELAVLPFDALPFDGKAAIEGRAISYVQSVSVLALMRERPRRTAQSSGGRELFAMGAPLYPEAAAGAAPTRASSTAAVSAVLRRGDPQSIQRAFDLLGQRWQPLPGAESEVQAIRALFRDSTALLGPDANEANLVQRDRSGELARYRFLHFAAHGFLSTNVPALSALVLSQAGNPPGFDGYVTAAEWPRYRLDSELIVLSACQSALGTQIQGEGVMGLPYALFVAGNRKTLLSLWPVADESTARFMTRFYTRLRAGAGVAEALAAVKREFRRSPRDADPLHWAGFVLYGD